MQSPKTTAYIQPAITNVVGENSLTQGGRVMTLTGTNFGPANNGEASASYGSFNIVSCTVSGHTEMLCTTVAGKGKELQWSVTVGGQNPATQYTDTLMNYALPTITSTVVTGGGSMGTGGASTIDIVGTNFGPSCSDNCVTVSYISTGPMSSSYPGAGTITCNVVDTGHVKLLCNTVAGVGIDFGWIVTVAVQASSSFASTVKYATP